MGALEAVRGLWLSLVSSAHTFFPCFPWQLQVCVLCSLRLITLCSHHHGPCWPLWVVGGFYEKHVQLGICEYLGHYFSDLLVKGLLKQTTAAGDTRVCSGGDRLTTLQADSIGGISDSLS